MHIVIHAGPPKTASSTLQTALWRNHKTLRDAGIELISPAKPNEWSLVALYAWPEGPVPGPLAERFATREEMRAWSAEVWTSFETRLDRTTADVVLISSEHFAGVHDKEAMVARLRQRADRLSIVAYARDPVAIYASDTDEWVRAGQDFGQLRKPAAFRYSMNVVRGYVPLLATDDLVIRSFDAEALVGGDIVADFFHVLSGLAGRTVTPEVPVERQNESLCGAATLWLLSANALGPFHGEAAARRSRLIEALRDAETLKPLPRLRMTDPEIAKAIRINNREVLDWLNAGPLAHCPLKTAPPEAQVPTDRQLQHRLRRWLFSYGRADHMRLVQRAVLTHRA